MLKKNENGEIVPEGVEDEPTIKEVVRTSRAFEREMIVQYISAVAEGQEDPKVVQAMEIIRGEIEKESHVDFCTEEILDSGHE
jgi:hypothetical protein